MTIIHDLIHQIQKIRNFAMLEKIHMELLAKIFDLANITPEIFKARQQHIIRSSESFEMRKETQYSAKITSQNHSKPRESKLLQDTYHSLRSHNVSMIEYVRSIEMEWEARNSHHHEIEPALQRPQDITKAFLLKENIPITFRTRPLKAKQKA